MTKNDNGPEGERLLRLPEVERKIGLRKTFIYAAMARGEFPSGLRISARAVLWPSSSIDAWISQQIAKAQTTPSAEG